MTRLLLVLPLLLCCMGSVRLELNVDGHTTTYTLTEAKGIGTPVYRLVALPDRITTRGFE